MGWYKVWAVTSASSGKDDPDYLELPDFTEQHEMYEYITTNFCTYDWVKYCGASLYWEKTDTLPDAILDKEIARQKNIINDAARNARRKIIQLERMRKPKDKVSKFLEAMDSLGAERVEPGWVIPTDAPEKP